ncbi:MAG: restriction endonuclease [Bacteroidales bacterium]|nr:restriction endonuclease [Bacteroidales bacterium]
MDFKDSIKHLSERIMKLKDSLQTEEATKNAFIMPFINALGYDVFDPLEVVPEMVCDIGMKKGEKIDYAILKDGQPILLIECKHWKENLNLHDNQLMRYFNVSKAKFGLLTNGIKYRFYTDLVEKNIMDTKPFLEVDMTDISDAEIEELKKFHKSYYSLENILSSASELKYTNELKQVIAKEFANPSPEFVRLLAKNVYDGVMRGDKIMEQFTAFVKKSINSYINEIISDRLENAIKLEHPEQEKKEEPTAEVAQTAPIEEEEKQPQVVTTTEELEGFFAIKSILRDDVDPSRLSYRDYMSYFCIILDDRSKRIVARLYFNKSNKYLGVFDSEWKEHKYSVETIDDIYKYAEELKVSLHLYLDKN